MITKSQREELFFILSKNIDGEKEVEKTETEISVFFMQIYKNKIKERLNSLLKNWEEAKLKRVLNSGDFMESYFRGQDSIAKMQEKIYRAEIDNLNEQIINLLK